MYHVFGVPLRSGSLMRGSENDAEAYREAGFLRSLRNAVDKGDVARPRLRAFAGDGDRMDAAVAGLGSISLKEIQCDGARESAQRVLASVPAESPILVHFDVDVIRDNELPAAYFPHQDGLALSEVSDLLTVILRDPRVHLIEVSEYARSSIALRTIPSFHTERLVTSVACLLGESGGVYMLRAFRFVALALTLTLGCVAFAQDQRDQDRDRAKSGGAMTMTGCLLKGQADGAFALTDTTGKTTSLTPSGNVKFDSHANHTVKVTGSMSSDGKAFQVTKIEHVSESCKP